MIFIGLFQLGIFDEFVGFDMQIRSLWEGKHPSEVGGVGTAGSVFP